MTLAAGSADLTEGQQLALVQLVDIAARSDGGVEVVGGPRPAGSGTAVTVDVTLDCSGVPGEPGGLALQAREMFAIEVGPAFPFTVPQIRLPHARWAGVPHVQWGTVICLYAAPSVEWLPSDGMYGLLDRLITWLRRAAAGNLDPADQPLHPPVAYSSLSAGVAVVRPDLPVSAAPPPRAATVMVAACRQDREDRIDVTEWVTTAQWQSRYRTAELHGGLDASGYRLLGAAVVLLGSDIGFEYPDKADALLAGLAAAGADRAAVLAVLGTTAMINARLDAAHVLEGYQLQARPLCLFVGTPSRRMPGSRERLAHLVCWRVDETGQQILTRARNSAADDSALVAATAEWLEQASTTWIPVMEARPEVTRRRDTGSPAEWLTGKRVLILGCGALGAQAAEICVRAGAAELTVADNGTVSPGILVRQPYEDADIGQYKAVVLKARLNQIHADDRVSALPQDIITTVLTDNLDASQFDLIIDAAANASVTSRLEYCRALSGTPWPPVLTMLIGHDARRATVALARSDATGAGRDILRKLGIAACRNPAGELADIADDLYPEQPRALFQPEPGCSDPTFTGSAAETTALAAHLMTAALDALAGRPGRHRDQPLVAAVVRLDPASGVAEAVVSWLGWANDVVITDTTAGYQIRLSPAAVREMRAESTRGRRIRGRDIETGGMLLGEIDDACRCVWIDTATGPPPDSRLSAWHFDHGTQGTRELIDHYLSASRQITAFVGLWHTHPDHPAQPSPTDTAAMQQLLTPDVLDASRALMVILGGPPATWSAWLDHGRIPGIGAWLTRLDPAAQSTPPPVPAAHLASAWPGGFTISGRSATSGPARRSRLGRLRAWIRRPSRTRTGGRS